jgi:hypothetical protein
MRVFRRFLALVPKNGRLTGSAVYVDGAFSSHAVGQGFEFPGLYSAGRPIRPLYVRQGSHQGAAAMPTD